MVPNRDVSRWSEDGQRAESPKCASDPKLKPHTAASEQHTEQHTPSGSADAPAQEIDLLPPTSTFVHFSSKQGQLRHPQPVRLALHRLAQKEGFLHSRCFDTVTLLQSDLLVPLLSPTNPI